MNQISKTFIALCFRDRITLKKHIECVLLLFKKLLLLLLGS